MKICYYFIYFIIFFIICIYIYYNIIDVKYLKYYRNSYPIMIIAIIACNRFVYLNSTLNSLYTHIQNFEKDLCYSILYFDQGTVERYDVINKFKIDNSFLFNPNGMEFSFNTLFSYMYSEYVFILEEDWLVEKNIEKEILYPSFIMESLLILSKTNKIYGVILRESDHFEIHENITVKTEMGNHILYIGVLVLKFAYTNGASIYRTKTLKELETYNGELEVARFFLNKGYKVGFTYKGKKGKRDDIFFQHIMDHIGLHTSKSSICSIPLY